MRYQARSSREAPRRRRARNWWHTIKWSAGSWQTNNARRAPPQEQATRTAASSTQNVHACTADSEHAFYLGKLVSSC
jgi:hypothetical protein